MRTRLPVRRLVRGTFRVLDRLSPGWSAALAESLFRTPPRVAKTAFESAVLSRAHRETLTLDGARLVTWRWGPCGRRVLLVHGWGGHGGRLASFVDPLLEAGFSVVSFDAPAHGDSEGLRASVPEFASAIRFLHGALGPFSGLVGHSLGAAATMLALRSGLVLDRAVFLAPAVDPDRLTRRFVRLLGLPPNASASLRARYETRYGVGWEDLKAAIRSAPPTASRPRLLVFHDRRDVCVPIHDGAAIVRAWQGARLVYTERLGHHRILNDPSVVRRAVAFLLASRTNFHPAREVEAQRAAS